jgi:hypothetical protein
MTERDKNKQLRDNEIEFEFLVKTRKILNDLEPKPNKWLIFLIVLILGVLIFKLVQWNIGC